MEKTYCGKDIPEAEKCTQRFCNSYKYCIMRRAEWLFYTLQDKNAKATNLANKGPSKDVREESVGDGCK